MKKYLFILIYLSIVLFSSCKKNKNKVLECSDGSANYAFLGNSYEWQYIYHSNTNTTDSMVIRIDSIPNVGTYQAHITYLPSGSKESIFYHACGKDLYTSTNGNIEQYTHWWFSLDANEGDKWTRTFNDRIFAYQLISKNTSVTTPILNQTFNDCYQFTFQSSNRLVNADTIFFKPNIGVVYYKGIDASYELAAVNF